jgi:hypothetical protein
MKKMVIMLILAVVLLTVFCVVRDFCIKSVVGTVATNITGAPVTIGSLSLSLVKQSIKITDFKMYNPKGFPKDILVDIPKIGVAWDIGALFAGKIHLRELDLEIKEIGMEKNKDGKLNVDSLKIVEEQKEAMQKGIKPAKQLPMQMDVVDLAMGRVVDKDYSAGGEPVVKVYDINLKKTYKNITSAQQLAALIITEPLKAAGIQGVKTYGAAMLTGVAALPVAAAFAFTAKDYSQETFRADMDKVYTASLEAIKKSGIVKKEVKAKSNSSIVGVVDGASVVCKLKALADSSIQVTISARKFALPKADIASGVMYKLKEELK